MILVRLGSGEAGSEGGSWAPWTSGVAKSSLLMLAMIVNVFKKVREGQMEVV
jgi:hypothetical protein